MPTKPTDNLVEAVEETIVAAGDPKVSLWELAITFFLIGSTSFGGMWGATRKLESVLVDEKRWLSLDDQRAMMVAATLIPAPKFFSFGGLVGFRLHGKLGAMISLVALASPGALLVLTGVILLSPEVLGAPLIPIQRAVSIGVVGLLFGNAWHQLSSSKVSSRHRVIGVALALAVVVSTQLGVPLLAASIAGFAIGAFFMRPEPEPVK